MKFSYLLSAILMLVLLFIFFANREDQKKRDIVECTLESKKPYAIKILDRGQYGNKIDKEITENIILCMKKNGYDWSYDGIGLDNCTYSERNSLILPVCFGR